jgi:Tfp pilus assembly protein PilE
MKTQRERGFTLVQTLVVVAIISLLISMAVAAYATAVTKTIEAKKSAIIEGIAQAKNRYVLEHSVGEFDGITDDDLRFETIKDKFFVNGVIPTNKNTTLGKLADKGYILTVNNSSQAPTVDFGENTSFGTCSAGGAENDAGYFGGSITVNGATIVWNSNSELYYLTNMDINLLADSNSFTISVGFSTNVDFINSWGMSPEWGAYNNCMGVVYESISGYIIDEFASCGSGPWVYMDSLVNSNFSGNWITFTDHPHYITSIIMTGYPGYP